MVQVGGRQSLRVFVWWHSVVWCSVGLWVKVVFSRISLDCGSFLSFWSYKVSIADQWWLNYSFRRGSPGDAKDEGDQVEEMVRSWITKNIWTERAMRWESNGKITKVFVCVTVILSVDGIQIVAVLYNMHVFLHTFFLLAWTTILTCQRAAAVSNNNLAYLCLKSLNNSFISNLHRLNGLLHFVYECLIYMFSFSYSNRSDTAHWV